MIAVFASTSGSDLPVFFEEAKKLNIPCVLFTNKEFCKARQKAEDAQIPHFFVDASGKTREEFDALLLEKCAELSVSHIFLVGYMRIVSSVLTKKFAGKMFNIHPSLLPAFAGGMDNNVHEEVLKKGCKISGATLHLVTDDLDEGPIVMQKAVEIVDTETPETLKKKVQEKEKEMLCAMLRKLKANGEI